MRFNPDTADAYPLHAKYLRLRLLERSYAARQPVHKNHSSVRSCPSFATQAVVAAIIEQ